jgi:hypothetical protein
MVRGQDDPNPALTCVGARLFKPSYRGSNKEAKMLTEKDKDFHLYRAREELDQAYRSECATAASAHMKLSVLHMRRIKELDELCHGVSLSGRR